MKLLADQWGELIAAVIGAVLGWFSKWFTGRNK